MSTIVGCLAHLSSLRSFFYLLFCSLCLHIWTCVMNARAITGRYASLLLSSLSCPFFLLLNLFLRKPSCTRCYLALSPVSISFSYFTWPSLFFFLLLQRFRAAKELKERALEEQKLREEWRATGRNVPDAEEKWDSNVITPGTPFMDSLAKYLRFFIHKKQKEDEGWRNIKVVSMKRSDSVGCRVTMAIFHHRLANTAVLT